MAFCPKGRTTRRWSLSRALTISLTSGRWDSRATAIRARRSESTIRRNQRS
jgi:hypothetical protein